MEFVDLFQMREESNVVGAGAAEWKDGRETRLVEMKERQDTCRWRRCGGWDTVWDDVCIMYMLSSLFCISLLGINSFSTLVVVIQFVSQFLFST